MAFTRIINLLPRDEQQKRKVDALNYYTLMGGMVAVTGALVLAGMLLLFDQLYQVNLASLKEDKRVAEGQASLYLDTEKKAVDLEQQLGNFKRASQQTTHWSAVLTQLQALTPANVSVKSIDIKSPTAGQTAGQPNQQQSKTKVTGSADNRRSLGLFQIALAGSPYFKNVEIQTSNLSDTGVINFEIALDVAYDKLNGPLQ